MAVMINETQWQQLKQEKRQLREDLDRAQAELEKIKKDLDSVYAFMPECWPDDALIGEFVASLIDGTTTQPGHTDTCDCF